MKKNLDRDLLADVAERLINHLKNRTDVQIVKRSNKHLRKIQKWSAV